MNEWSNPAFLFNAVEALLWGGIAVFLAFRQDPRLSKWNQQLLVVSYALFALSDLIEMRTGAWWKPTSLLIFKGGCLTSIVWGMWQYWRACQRRPGS